MANDGPMVMMLPGVSYVCASTQNKQNNSRLQAGVFLTVKTVLVWHVFT